MTGSLKTVKQYWPDLVVSLLLAVTVYLIYAQVITFGFVGPEDEIMYSEFRARLDDNNPSLLKFSRMTSNALYWVPVFNVAGCSGVWLCGDNIGLLHLMNVSIHAFNAVLLFLVLRLATACVWRSAFAAALFSLHPINAESVVSWCQLTAQLEAFFFLLTFLVYINYIRRPDFKRYVPVVLCFVLGLLSRPSILYLPLLLLLFDFWPLARWRPENQGREEGRSALLKLAAEKIPLAIIAAGWLVSSLYVMPSFPAFPSGAVLPESRLFLFNLPVVYAAYLWAVVAPLSLPFFSPDVMPQPFMLPLWQVIPAAAGLLLASVVVVRKGNRYPFLITGWFWFLISLSPYAMTCVGQQKTIMGRLGYLPMIGIFILVAWGGAQLLQRTGQKKWLPIMATVVSLTVLATISWFQARHWSDRVSYFQYAVKTRPDCEKTHSVLGEVLCEAGRINEAVEQFEIALRINPDYAVAHNHLALMLLRLNEQERALGHLQKAVRSDPGYGQAHNNLANLLADLGDLDGAIVHYNEVLRIDPTLFQAHNNLATVLLEKGEYDQAVMHFEQALRINPGYQTARDNLIKVQNMRKKQ